MLKKDLRVKWKCLMGVILHLKKAQAVEVQEGVKKRVTFVKSFSCFFFSVSFSNDMTFSIMAFMNFGAISVCSLFVGFSICFQKRL